MNNPMSANARQVAGSHYVAKIQHWDLVHLLGLGYFEGQITKYVTRHRKKNGLQDLQKASHFLQKLLELAVDPHYPRARAVSSVRIIPLISDYSQENRLDGTEAHVIRLICTWNSRDQLLEAAGFIQHLQAEYPDGRYVNQDQNNYGGSA